MSRRTKTGCIAVLLMTFAGSALAARWPVMLGNICAEISASSASQEMLYVFAAVCISAAGINIFRRVFLDFIIASHEAETRGTAVEVLLKMPVANISDCPSGEKTSQINQGIAGYSQLIKLLCGDASGVVLTAAFTLREVWRSSSGTMAGFMCMYLFVAVCLSYLQIRSQNGIREDIQRQKNALDGQTVQSINNLELIRSLNAEAFERRRLAPAIDRASSAEKKHHCFMGMFDFFKQAAAYLFLAGMLGLCMSGRISGTDAAAVSILFLQMLKPIDEVYRFMDEGSASVIKARGLLQILAGEPDPVFSIETHGTDSLKHGIPEILFEDVRINNLRYRGLRIPCGGKTALCGPTGCGKSTVIRGIMRYFGHCGRIFVFGAELGTVSQHELAGLVYYTPKDDLFFAGTVRENLTYGLDREVTELEALGALSRACLLEDGILERVIGEKGSGLSSGQRQRLALARAFLRTPKLYIFDESTANLDELTAERVLGNIEAHAASIGAGIIYISRDSNVVRRCSEVVELGESTEKTAA